jgi:hypothetical protein
LVKLASIYSATDDQARYVQTLDKVVAYHLSRRSPAEALEYLEKILQATRRARNTETSIANFLNKVLLARAAKVPSVARRPLAAFALSV